MRGDGIQPPPAPGAAALQERPPEHAAARRGESAQSGLATIMPLMRFCPDGGSHCVTEIACSARARRVSPGVALPPSAIGLSIAMNHCGVLRKITGFLERQECGY